MEFKQLVLFFYQDDVVSEELIKGPGKILIMATKTTVFHVPTVLQTVVDKGPAIEPKLAQGERASCRQRIERSIAELDNVRFLALVEDSKDLGHWQILANRPTCRGYIASNSTTDCQDYRHRPDLWA